jgi:hypothetical protein
MRIKGPLATHLAFLLMTPRLDALTFKKDSKTMSVYKNKVIKNYQFSKIVNSITKNGRQS